MLFILHKTTLAIAYSSQSLPTSSSVGNRVLLLATTQYFSLKTHSFRSLLVLIFTEKMISNHVSWLQSSMLLQWSHILLSYGQKRTKQKFWLEKYRWIILIYLDDLKCLKIGESESREQRQNKSVEPGYPNLTFPPTLSQPFSSIIHFSSKLWPDNSLWFYTLNPNVIQHLKNSLS